jgi:endogenous inhibitor of DNA gyrase (YacG/DUF329 family)
MTSPNDARRRRSGCPVCGKAPAGSRGPFCSQGCRDRDLLQWLGDGYALPGPPAEESGEDGLDSRPARPL